MALDFFGFWLQALLDSSLFLALFLLLCFLSIRCRLLSLCFLCFSFLAFCFLCSSFLVSCFLLSWLLGFRFLLLWLLGFRFLLLWLLAFCFVLRALCLIYFLLCVFSVPRTEPRPTACKWGRVGSWRVSRVCCEQWIGGHRYSAVCRGKHKARWRSPRCHPWWRFCPGREQAATDEKEYYTYGQNTPQNTSQSTLSKHIINTHDQHIFSKLLLKTVSKNSFSKQLLKTASQTLTTACVSVWWRVGLCV